MDLLRASGRMFVPVFIAATVLGTAWTGRATSHADIDPSLQAGDVALIQVSAGTAWTVAAELTSAGASEVAAFDGVDIVTARITGASLAVLNTERAVLRATTDAIVTATDGGDDDDDDRGSRDRSRRDDKDDSVGSAAIRAPQALSRSSGAGVVVALMDSGIAQHPDLLPGKVVGRKSFVSDGATALDPAGHGTHLAGVIAGNGATFKGVAPDARLVDLRVLDRNGNGTLRNVVAAFDWLLEHRKALGVNVLNLSIGTTQVSSYHSDLLAALAEAAWFAGISVVAAAGNEGPRVGTLATPGADPFVITAGSFDDQGTVSGQDDRESSFSSRGLTKDRHMKPDVLAPGRKVLSLRAARATGDALHGLRAATAAEPIAVVKKDNDDDDDDDDDEKKRERATEKNRTESPLYVRMTGTSVSSAMVAGVAALVLSYHTTYTPTQVKAAIVASGRDISGSPRDAVDALRALTAQGKAANKGLVPSQLLMATLAKSGFGGGTAWEGVTWEGLTWEAVNWEAVTWEGVTWESVSWEGVMWETVGWEQPKGLGTLR